LFLDSPRGDPAKDSYVLPSHVAILWVDWRDWAKELDRIDSSTFFLSLSLKYSFLTTYLVWTCRDPCKILSYKDLRIKYSRIRT